MSRHSVLLIARPPGGLAALPGDGFAPARRRIFSVGAAACFLGGALAVASSAEETAEPAPETVSATLPEVVVSGSAAEGSAANGYRVSTVSLGPLGCAKLQDVPFSVNVVSSDLIDNIQATTVQKAVQYNPTVNETSGMNAVGGGATFSIRGFTSTNATIDGLRVPNMLNVPVANMERIEIMNGPAGFLYGVANPGGTLNFILKRPTDTPLATVMAGVISGSQMFTEGDFGGPLDKDGKFAYRATLLFVDDGETAISGQDTPRDLEDVALDWHYAPEGTLSLDYYHYTTSVKHGADLFSVQLAPVSKKIGTTTYQFSGLTALPSVPDAATNFMPSFSSATDRADRVAVGITQKLDDALTVRGNVAYTDSENIRSRAADLLLDNSGDYWLTRNYYDKESSCYQGNLFLDAAFNTWSVEHKLSLGVVGDTTATQYAYPYQNNSSAVAFGLFNLSDGTPMAHDLPGSVSGGPDRTTQDLTNTSIILADTVTFNDQWSLLAGGNYAQIEDKQWGYSLSGANVTSSDKPENDAGELTPAVALMFKPIPSVTTYASFIEGLQEGATAPSTAANANDVLAPYVSKQVEVGAKSQLGGVLLTGALYHIEVPYAFTDASDNIFKPAGTEVHNGAEIAATGKLSENWTLTGGFSLLEATVKDVGDTMTTGAGGRKVALADTTPAGVPNQLARLYVEYAVPPVPGLFLNGGISFTGAEWVDAGNTLAVPWVMTGNVGVRYETKMYGHPMTARFNVENVTGENYWVATGSGLALGQPCTFSFSVQFAWF